MAEGDYAGPATIWYKGKVEQECTSISFTIDTGNRPVITGPKGRAGRAKGALQCSVDVRIAIPEDGMPVRWDLLAVGQKQHPFTIRFSNIQYEVYGDVSNFKTDSGAEGNHEGSFTIGAKIRAHTTV